MSGSSEFATTRVSGTGTLRLPDAEPKTTTPVVTETEPKATIRGDAVKKDIGANNTVAPQEVNTVTLPDVVPTAEVPATKGGVASTSTDTSLLSPSGTKLSLTNPSSGPLGLRHSGLMSGNLTLGGGPLLSSPGSGIGDGMAAKYDFATSMATSLSWNPIFSGLFGGGFDSLLSSNWLLQWPSSPTASTEKRSINTMSGLVDYAQASLEKFKPFAQTLKADHPAAKDYAAFADAVAAAAALAQDPKASDEALGKARLAVYNTLEAFNGSMTKALTVFSKAWAAGTGFDAKFRESINVQFAELVKAADPNADPKKVQFTDANKAKWPQVMKDMMGDCKTVAELQKKLGLKQDGVFGPQLLLAVQLREMTGMGGAGKIEDLRAEVEKQLSKNVDVTEAWTNSLVDLQEIGLQGVLAKQPEILQALSKLPAGLDLAAPKTGDYPPDYLTRKISELTGVKLNVNQAYLLRHLYDSGMTAKDGQLVKRSGGIPTGVEIEKMTDAYIEKSGGYLQKKLDTLSVTATQQASGDQLERLKKLTAAFQKVKSDPMGHGENSYERVGYAVTRLGPDTRRNTMLVGQALSTGIALKDMTPEELTVWKDVYKDHFQIKDGRFYIDQAEADAVETLTDAEEGKMGAKIASAVTDVVTDLRKFVVALCPLLPPNPAMPPIIGDFGTLLNLLLFGGGGGGSKTDELLAQAAAQIDESVARHEAFEHELEALDDKGEVERAKILREHDKPIEAHHSMAASALKDLEEWSEAHSAHRTQMMPPSTQWGLNSKRRGLGVGADATEYRSEHAKVVAEKRQEESRKSAEAYTEAVQKKGVEQHKEWRKQNQVAATEQANNGQVIERNAEGEVIGVSTLGSTKP